jgi:hypothetical protein
MIQGPVVCLGQILGTREEMKEAAFNHGFPDEAVLYICHADICRGIVVVSLWKRRS